MVYADVPTSYSIEGVPLIDQGNKKWCGVGCVVMLLQFWRVDVSLDEAGLEIDPENDGCYTYELVNYLERYEFQIYEFNSLSEVKEWLSKGHPVIVLTWTDETKNTGHYRLITGYDEVFIYVNDPHGFTDKFTYEEFLVLWSKYNQYSLTISPLMSFINDPLNHNKTINSGGVIKPCVEVK